MPQTYVFPQLQVPAVPSSELLHCDFIVIQYVVDLHVNAAVSNGSILSERFHVLIGKKEEIQS